MLVCKRYYSESEQACSALASTNHSNAARIVNTAQTVQHAHISAEVEYECFVDGSWSDDGRAGIGVYLTRQGIGIKWLSKSVQALGPSQVEARSVLEAYKMMQKMQCNHGAVLSDSLETVDSLSHSDPRIHDWRSYDHIWSAWMMQSLSEGRYKVEYRSRDEEGITVAHKLANQGRIGGCDMEGDGIFTVTIEELT